MGEYIDPSQLPINRPPEPKSTKPERPAISLPEAQRMLPAMLGKLFVERRDLVKIVDFVHPAETGRMRVGWLSRVMNPVPSETLIPIRPYSDSASSELYAYDNETEPAMISVPGVHQYRHFTRGKAGFRDVSGEARGYKKTTVPVLVTQDGQVRFPLTQSRRLDGREPASPGIIADTSRNCLLASLYEGYSPVSGYEYADILMAQVEKLLATPPTK